ncbi:wax synthase family protein [Aspergillus clavatus NRRL 1]|uniref:Wax synthase domain-containing protein n=1 Tax=Aspergillus clavatus (strain ATCC 1007 / CBS 513.65 / DSM 816 / NCTC 3887 / NRRL 1 / QM 1276 / 107) TaxID=344612 RepID=A1C4D4_ASPCL|nr:uncharacterized protein ACLA_059380 [Aspergillus clavatus NRRL 1]EAW15274.1 conserved hypothetical protein [Aspergillus clavatus NRRL 1]
MASPSTWIIPLTQWILVQLLTGCTIAFAPASSKLRPAVTVAILALAASFQLQTPHSLAQTRARGPLAAMCWVNVLNAIDLLLLSRVSFAAQIAWESSTGKKFNTDTNSDTRLRVHLRRLRWSLETPFNYRRINTPWQIHAVPPFNAADPTAVPARAVFLRACALKVLASLLVLQLCTVDARDEALARVIPDLVEGKVVLWPWWEGWTTRRAVVQVLFCVAFGCVTRAAILGTYNLVAGVLVLARVWEPVDWPPIFGEVGEMYSLTRVWGIAWHQILRQLITSNADFVLSRILRLPAGTLARSLRLILAFAVSGLVHFFMDLGFGVSLDQSGGLWFFCLQVPGILLENLVWSTCHATIKQMSVRMRRVVGDSMNAAVIEAEPQATSYKLQATDQAPASLALIQLLHLQEEL